MDKRSGQPKRRPRQGKKPTTAHYRLPRRAGPPSRVSRAEWGLVLVDSRKKRQTERRLYRRRTKELTRVTETLRKFENVDIPAFQQWLEAEFAATLKACHEASSTGAELEELTETVRCYAHVHRLSLREAFHRVKAAKQAGQELDFGEADEVGNSEEEDRDGDDFDTAFADFIEALTGERIDQDAGPDHRTSAGDPRWRHTSEKLHDHSDSMTSAEYLKSIYRQLVRILHPDTNDRLTQERQNLWHEVQEAYDWRDVQRLERLLEQVSSDRASKINLEAIPISHIMDLRRDLERRIRTIKQQLTVARHEPPWDFSAVKEDPQRLGSLRRQIGAQLGRDLRVMQSEVQRLKRQILKWEAPEPRRPDRRSEKKGRPGPRRNPGQFPPHWFFGD